MVQLLAPHRRQSPCKGQQGPPSSCHPPQHRLGGERMAMSPQPAAAAQPSAPLLLSTAQPGWGSHGHLPTQTRPGAPGLLRGQPGGTAAARAAPTPAQPRALRLAPGSPSGPGLSPSPEEPRQRRRAKGRGVTRTKCLEGCRLLRPLSNRSSRRSPGPSTAAHTGTGCPTAGSRAFPERDFGRGSKRGCWSPGLPTLPPRAAIRTLRPARGLCRCREGLWAPESRRHRAAASRPRCRRRSRRRDQNRKPGQTEGRAGQDEPELGMRPDGAPAGCAPPPAAPGRARSGRARAAPGPPAPDPEPRGRRGPVPARPWHRAPAGDGGGPGPARLARPRSRSRC
ncbi:uncharacterized protein GJ701_001739 [Geothlypis trichas]